MRPRSVPRSGRLRRRASPDRPDGGAAGRRSAVVTGGNRGIGFEVCRRLGRLGMRVLLTAREARRGRAAAARLRAEGLDVTFHQLDVTDGPGVARLAAFLRDTWGVPDVLVNNAGVYLDEDVPGLRIGLDTVRRTMDVNAYGPLRLCQALIPMMRRRRYGRVVNVSSGSGQLSGMTGTTLAYRISKVSLNAITRVLADEVRGTGILINAMCPGWVRTDMGGPGATRSVEEGADTVIYLATLPGGRPGSRRMPGPTGGFYRDRRPIPW